MAANSGNNDVGIKITTDSSQINGELDKLFARFADLQAKAHISITAGGGGGNAANTAVGSSTSAGVAANSATSAPTNTGRVTTNGAQSAPVTHSLNGSSATPAAESVSSPGTRSGVSPGNTSGATRTAGAGTSGAASTVGSSADPGGLATYCHATTEMGYQWNRARGAYLANDGWAGWSSFTNRMHEARLAGRELNYEAQGIQVDQDPVRTVENAGLFRAEQTAARVQARHFNASLTTAKRLARVAGYGPATDLATRRVKYDPDGIFDEEPEPKPEKDDFGDRIASGRRSAAVSGYGPRTILKSRRIADDTNGTGAYMEAMQARFDAGQYGPSGDIEEDQDNSLLARYNRWGKTPGGRIDHRSVHCVPQ